MIPATVIAPQQLRPAGDDQVSPTEFGRHYLFEGDSWASFGSVLGNGIPHFLQFEERVLITSCATPGDTLARMNDWRNREFSRLVRDWQFDGILISAGGNDLIDALPEIIRPGGMEPQACIRWAAWYRLAAALETGYAALARKVADTRANRTTRIYLHTYDYPTPRPAGAVSLPGLKVGPWLWPALREIPEAIRPAVADLLFARLRALVRGVELPNVTVIDTAGACDRAAPGTSGASGDWVNEIHPSGSGYRKLAGRWQAALG